MWSSIKSMFSSQKPPSSRLSEFTLQKVLGKGTTGIVYLALTKERKHVVIKIIDTSKLTEQNKVLLRNELQIMEKLSHPECKPFIICYHEHFEEDGKTFIVMEYFEAPELFVMAERSEFIPAIEKLRVMIKVAEAIEYIHSQGIAHRDIKLENILGTLKEIKLIDFGYACSITDKKFLCDPYAKLGSPHYAAPELFESFTTIDDPLAADVYAFGIVMFGLMFGVLPYEINENQTPLQTISNAKVPRTGRAALDNLIISAMSLRPVDRPKMTEVVQTLRNIENNKRI
jgi:serine/threonine protein kinase